MRLVKVNQDTLQKMHIATDDHTVKIHASIAEEVVYKGDYEVLPKGNEETILHTSGMKMSDDVVIFKVPMYTVTNATGGDTCYIGGEYHGKV